MKTLTRWMAILLIGSILGACGGGGGGGSGGTNGGGGNVPSQPPRIEAVALVYAPLNLPSGKGTTLVVVRIEDASTAAPRSQATVTANGTPLEYVAEKGVFRGWLIASTGDNLALVVQSGGSSWQAESPLPPTHPEIVSPWPGGNGALPVVAEAARNHDLFVAWEGVLPDSEYHYAVAALNESGDLAWPGVARLATISSGQGRSFTIPADSLAASDYYISTGIVKSLPIANAAAGSALSIGAFSTAYSKRILDNNVTLKRLVLRSGHRSGPLAVGSGDQRQVMVDGIYEDVRAVPSTRDLTTQVTWTSDQEAVLSINARGMMTGGNAGTATLTASYAGVSASSEVRVLDRGVASPVADAYAFNNNAAHTSHAIFGGVTLPGAAMWSATFPAAVYHPIITQDSIFALAADVQPEGVSLYALDALSGTRKWGPVRVKSPQQWAFFGYERGRLLTLDNDCVMRGYDAANGAVLWTTNLKSFDPDRIWSCASHVTTWRGIAYVNVAGVAGTVMAIDVVSGALLWKTYLRAGGSSTFATVDDDGVYTAETFHVYKLDPRSGAILWHRAGPGSGGSSAWSVLYDGRLYARTDASSDVGLILDSQGGNTLDTFKAGFLTPPIDQTRMYIVEGNEIRAVNLQGGGTAWLVAAPDGISGVPMVVDDTLFYIASMGSSLRAIRSGTGSENWQMPLGPPLLGPDPGGVMAAGHGLLAVTVGNKLSVFRLHD